jgi:hypothetical protein
MKVGAYRAAGRTHGCLLDCTINGLEEFFSGDDNYERGEGISELSGKQKKDSVIISLLFLFGYSPPLGYS